MYNVSITNDGFAKVYDPSNDFMQIIRLDNQQLNYDDSFVSIVNMAGRETSFSWAELNGINNKDDLKALLGFNNDNWAYTFSIDCNYFIFDGGLSGEVIKIPINNSVYNVGPSTVKISSNDITYNFPYASLTNIANQTEFIHELNHYTGMGKRNSYTNHIDSTNTLTNVFSLGVRGDYGYHYKVGGLTLANDTDSLATFYIYKNPSVTGQSFTNLDTSNSLLNVDVTGTTVTGGSLLKSYVLSGKNSIIIDEVNPHLYMDPSNYLTVAVKNSNGAATGQLGASMNIFEFF